MPDKTNNFYTNFVWINTRKCSGCWRCITACPLRVIGKVNFLWHKHIKLIRPDNCVGCKRCMKACPRGVFNEV